MVYGGLSSQVVHSERKAVHHPHFRKILLEILIDFDYWYVLPLLPEGTTGM